MECCIIDVIVEHKLTMKVPFPFSYVLIKSVFIYIMFKWSFVFRI